jgi:tRNA pseudouridine55 synthase
MAQGVLLVFMGKALKLLSFIPPEHLDKTYLMRVTLGQSTDSYDATGVVDYQHEGPIDFTTESVLNELRNFVGKYNQTPPAFSAIKVAGKRAYAMARAGEEVKLTSRKVHVTSIRMVSDFSLKEQRQLLMRIHCSRGTYVRSVAHDLGKNLGCGGHLSYLLRERVGKWSYTDAFPMWKVEQKIPFEETSSFVHFSDILSAPKATVTAETEGRIKNGSAISQRDIVSIEAHTYDGEAAEIVQIVSSNGELLGLYAPKQVEKEGKTVQKLFPVRVFN